MDPLKQELLDKLAQTSLSPPQVRDGITTCFILTNRRFLHRRMGKDHPTAEIDAATKQLVHQVFAETGISATQTTLVDLRRAWRILDVQLGFEAEPELMNHHCQIIEQLFELAEKENQK